MRQSELFTKPRREPPADEISRNAQLLIRAGYVHKEMAGVFTYLPLGLLVHKKIERIIREEMNAIGGQEVLMTTLQDPEIWKKSGRWDDAVVDNWFKTMLVNGNELGIANTHEEPLVALLAHFTGSYRDFPLAIYQFQTKFRNELRAKSGLMRAREFVMKDLYSFSKTEEEFRTFYERCAGAYRIIFDRLGIGHLTYRTVAAGGSFTSDFTDEFQTLSTAGEDTIVLDEQKGLAINKEIFSDELVGRFGLNADALREARAIEVGNIFPLGTKYSEALGLIYTDQEGAKHPVVMGSYGIGLGRVMGTIVEVLADERGIVWPLSVAPFAVHLTALGDDDSIYEAAEQAYRTLQESGIEVFFDDRAGISPGEKLAVADLLGMPYRIVLSRKTLEAKRVEFSVRAGGEPELLELGDAVRKLEKATMEVARQHPLL